MLVIERIQAYVIDPLQSDVPLLNNRIFFKQRRLLTDGMELFVSSDNESILSVITMLPKKYLCSLGKSLDKIIERLSLNAVVVGFDFYEIKTI